MGEWINGLMTFEWTIKNLMNKRITRLINIWEWITNEKKM